MGHIEPLVSVVIPTFNRPHLVARAVHSALTQTLDAIEVIVVVDSPDETTSEVLRQIDDPRLRVKTLPMRLGPGGARNAGISEARGQWVAFLDDDDEWFPKKLEKQLQTARQSHCSYLIIACRLIARGEVEDFVWPRRFPRPNESLSEYLFCRKSPFWGEGLVQTSMIFTTKELLKRIPFRSGLERHVDIDWLLRATALRGVDVELVFIPEPLVIWHIEENRTRISNRTNWRYSLSWIQANRHLFTPCAYTSCVMTWMSEKAAREEDWNAFFLLLREAYRHGKPTVSDTLMYLGTWLLPQRSRHQISALFTRRHCSGLVKRS